MIGGRSERSLTGEEGTCVFVRKEVERRTLPDSGHVESVGCKQAEEEDKLSHTTLTAAEFRMEEHETARNGLEEYCSTVRQLHLN